MKRDGKKDDQKLQVNKNFVCIDQLLHNYNLIKMVQWIELYMSCPVSSTGCSKSQDPGYWYHSGGCGGSMEISTDVYMRCKKCYTSGHWKGWSFSCSRHPLQYEKADDRDFLQNLGFVTNLYATDSEKKNILKLIIRKILEEMDLTY
ncbi:hypothetical protein GLOIN_2v1676924 [Rhizophagus clarus]|uniref:Uncharacterized protein n=1 Tax=Rhizophagus clarus TaxID=94130 RepID=A0A8H3KV42_9GLOM|nr:hypothetical protein GLOIN_2v1676924 [Rhizophagus clarus]